MPVGVALEAALAAAAGMDLGLHHPDRAAEQSLATCSASSARIGDPALQHGDAVLGQHLLGLVFVDVHR